jgi:nucleoporin GLE1
VLHFQFARLAKFLRSTPLPVNQYTPVSLNAFLRLSDARLILLCLQMAGFALFKGYKSQFIKMLEVILVNFLVNLKSHNVQELKFIAANIHAYIEDNMFLQAPEGRNLFLNTISRASMA